ncbi:MAG: DUF2461 family protein [Catenulispora sp.]|nr:DUF2461 family protein [Catenulispora sp.]
MGLRFTGWTERAYDVLLELGGEPSKETREGVRRPREQLVRKPMIDLLNDMAEADPFYEDFSVWGYASTAFWWQNQCATVRAGRHVEIAFRFNLDGLHVKAAWWYADPDQIARFRSAVAAAESGSELEGLLAGLARSGHEILGDVMKRVPRGIPADHPRAGLLKHRSLLVGRELESVGPVQDVSPVLAACERFRPLLTWLCTHVEAPDGSAPEE